MSAVLERPTPSADRGADVPEAPDVPTRGARVAAVVAVVALLVAVVGSLSGTVEQVLPGGSVAVVEAGGVELADGSGWRTLDVGDGVPRDGRVRATSPTARLRTGEDALHLLEGTVAVLAADEVTLERGSVRIDGDATDVAVDTLRVVGEGIWRVDDGGRPRLAVYAGSATLDDGDRSVEVPALRQVTVRDRAIGAAAVAPLRYLASDPFDAELLAGALRTDELAAGLARSLTAAHGTAPREPAFYEAFAAVGPVVGARLTDLAAEVVGPRIGPPADVLVAAVAIDAIAAGTSASRAASATAVAQLRGAGATWGLVLMEAGLDGDALTAAADRALERAEASPPPPDPVDDDPATPPPADEPAPDPSPTSPSPPPSDGSGGGSGGGGSGGGSGGTPDGGTDGGSPDDDQDPADDGPLAPVEDLLRGSGESLGGVVEDTTDGLGDVVGGVDSLLSPGGLLGGG